MKQLIYRPCPICKSDKSETLLDVDAKDFVDINPGYDHEKLKQSGMLDLVKIAIVSCDKCSFVYTNKQLSDDLYGTLYGEVIDVVYSKQKIFRNEKRLRYIKLWEKLANYLFKDKPSESKTVSIVEFGAGWGDFLQIVKGPGINVTAIEYDERKRKFLSENQIENYKVIGEVPPKNIYNVFFSNAVFEHLLDPIGDMQDMADMLSDDFVGYLAVPNYNSKRLKESIDSYRKGDPQDKDISTWEHVNYFSPETLWDFLDRFDFEIFDIESSKVISRKKIQSTEVFFRRKQ